MAKDFLVTNYYLDNSSSAANDTNSGISQSSPFKTLAALNRAFSPGDTINIKAGTTYTGNLDVTADGTAAAPIKFTSYGAGADPVINSNNAIGINLSGANYVVVDNIKIAGASFAAVNIDGASSHNIVSNAEITNSGIGVAINGNDNIARDNYIHDLNLVRNTVGGDDDYGANGFLIEGNNNEFFGNTIVNAKGPSYDYGEDGGGFEIYGTVSGVSIHDNTVRGSVGFMEVGGQGGDTVKNISVYNNISDNNGGFHWLHNNPGSGNFGVTLSDMKVHSNTINEPTSNNIIGFGGPVAAGSYTFTDNIVNAPKATYVFNQTGNYHTDNFYETAQQINGSGEVNGDVTFVNPSAGDFHVVSGNAAESYGVVFAGSSPTPTPTPDPAPTPPPPATTTPASYTIGAGSDTLVLKVSQDAYNAGAQYTVKIDGAQVGETLTAAAIHGSGQSDTVTIKGDYSAGNHTVAITFLNDEYGGTASTDRNLYTDSATYNGAPVTGATLGLYSNGTASFTVNDTTGAAPAINYVTGTNRDNTLNGTSGNDVINSKQGNDIIHSGAGNDTVVFAKGDGWDWVSDFARGSDVMKIVGITQSEVTWHATSWNGVGSGMEIDVNNGGSGGVFLKGLTALTLSDFVFS